jgi:hypothetical protein
VTEVVWALLGTLVTAGAVALLVAAYAVSVLDRDRLPRAEPPPAPLLRMRGLYVRFGGRPGGWR